MREKRIEKLREGDWDKKFLSLADVSEVIDEPIKIIGPDGNTEVMLVRPGVSDENLRKAWYYLRGYNPSTSNRGTASGVSKLRKRKDGSISKTNIGETVNSGVLGFYDRYPRIPYCRKCAWNQQNPEKFAAMLPLLQEVSEKFYQLWPEKWLIQSEVIKKTHQDFVIPGTVFTTITVNKNYRTAAHRDPRNLKDSISTMLVIHDGKVDGGELILPELDVALRFRNGDLVWFENQKRIHGNAPVTRYGNKSQRCSLVFYYREKMLECGSHAEELERAKNRKMGEGL